MMKYLVPRFLIVLLLGMVFADALESFSSPALLLLLPAAAILVTAILTESYGRWGFDTHWSTYEISSHLRSTAVTVCFALGVLIEAGYVGRFLVWLGTLMQ